MSEAICAKGALPPRISNAEGVLSYKTMITPSSLSRELVYGQTLTQHCPKAFETHDCLVVSQGSYGNANVQKMRFASAERSIDQVKIVQCEVKVPISSTASSLVLSHCTYASRARGFQGS